MIENGNIWFANTETGEKICLPPYITNHHGLITGADNAEVDLTARVLAEGFSSLGIPVIMTDIHRDLAGMMLPGTMSASLKKKLSRLKIDETSFHFQGFPVTLWDIYGETGIPLRATLSELGPVFISQMLHLNNPQKEALKTIYRVAAGENLLLVDIKDLKAMVNYTREHIQKISLGYGQMKDTVLNELMLALSARSFESLDMFIGEPSLNITDCLQAGYGGFGMVNILDSNLLVRDRMLYASVLLWMLSELKEVLPNAADCDRPKAAFIIDEAHLLFRDTNREFIEIAEQAVRQLHQKGVSVFFCSQKVNDIPDEILKHLENRIQLSPHAYTPVQLKDVRAVADLFRKNPTFDTFDALKSLGPGEALISLIGDNNRLLPVQKGYILPPQSFLSQVTDTNREECIKGNFLYAKYSKAFDPDSAYEFLSRLSLQEADAAEQAKLEAIIAKEQEKADAARVRQEARRAQAEENARRLASTRIVGNTAAGTTAHETAKNKSALKNKSGKKTSKKSKKNSGKGLFGFFFK
ncbi:MAG: DUF853 family protein [Oscillospiraceae bacterium]|nr:DUF853 family protein [Oscillospiraceae bacterium]